MLWIDYSKLTTATNARVSAKRQIDMTAVARCNSLTMTSRWCARRLALLGKMQSTESATLHAATTVGCARPRQEPFQPTNRRPNSP